MIWESGELRRDFLLANPQYAKKLSERLSWIKALPEDSNIYLLPEVDDIQYEIYAPLFHLLPKRTLERFGLPILHKGIWPPLMYDYWVRPIAPRDFLKRLQSAFAAHIWPLINSGSSMRSFAKDDPIRVLSHGLNYWLPYAYLMTEQRMREFPRSELDEQLKEKRERAQSTLPDGITAEVPRMGGPIWTGEDEAWDATEELVSTADQNGKLRQIIDAVRSNRVEEDFSPCWSFAKEDFERKLYSKRSKIKVEFVQLDDTIPVHSGKSEVIDNLLWEDMMALVDAKDRRVVVCLRNGITKVGEISRHLGYANHSPISKSLARIREQARAYFNHR